MQILSLIYNFILICLAAWWLSDLSRHADLHTFEVWCTLFIIILHAVIILKILNPSILASIKRSTALGLNVLTVGYWVGVFVPHMVGLRTHRQKKVRLQNLYSQG